MELTVKGFRLLPGPDGSATLYIPIGRGDAETASAFLASASAKPEKAWTLRLTCGGSRTDRQNALVWALCAAIARHESGNTAGTPE